MTERMAYVGRLPCGCAVAAVVDEPARSKDVAKSVADFVRRGYTVERQTCRWVRENLASCSHKPPRAPEKQPDLFAEASRG